MGYVVYQRHSRMPLSYDLTPFQILGQKFVKFFPWYFGPNDDTKRTFWNELTYKNTKSRIAQCDLTRKIFFWIYLWISLDPPNWGSCTCSFLRTPEKSREAQLFVWPTNDLPKGWKKNFVFQVSYSYKLILQVIFQSFF